ncbi:unnamed protein product [Adineta steineri]|uniref:Uncharacterized protein n=1 Tax=Adineta steineri TaxID=433720 RepID=A0A814HXP8_9BILA|nr:unnamed protein product [Adineta steineri]CAF1458269.1 unnamed protein product [Adineta steineri]
MSSLLMNLRQFSRLPVSVHISRMNSTSTTTADSSKIKLPRDVADPNKKHFRIGYMLLGVIGLLALFRMSRKEEQLIAHTADKNPHPKSASTK